MFTYTALAASAASTGADLTYRLLVTVPYVHTATPVGAYTAATVPLTYAPKYTRSSSAMTGGPCGPALKVMLTLDLRTQAGAEAVVGPLCGHCPECVWS